jgi:hypothetical protein
LRTLFYFDESTARESMAFRASVANVFDQFFDLGPRAEAQPNLGCNRLYFSDGTSGSPKNVTAPLP